MLFYVSKMLLYNFVLCVLRPFKGLMHDPTQIVNFRDAKVDNRKCT